MSATYPKPTSDQVVAALRQTGFLLEQETAETLRDNYFHVQLGRAYVDPDEGKSREIDVVGYKQFFRSEQSRSSFGVRLVVECKNVRSPLVVVGRMKGFQGDLNRGPVFEASFWADSGFSFPMPGSVDSLQYGSPWHWLGMGLMPGHPRNADFRGDQLLAMNLKGSEWRADNEGFFNSVVMPMAKAVMSLSKSTGSGAFDPKINWASGEVFFPLLITTGPLLRVDTSSPELSAVDVPWVTVARELHTSTVRGVIHVAVVQSSHFENYIQTQVLPFGRKVGNVLDRNPSALSVREAFELF